MNLTMATNSDIAPAFAPTVKVEEIANGEVKMVSLTTFPNLDAVKTHFIKLGYSFN